MEATGAVEVPETNKKARIRYSHGRDFPPTLSYSPLPVSASIPALHSHSAMQ